MKRLIKSFLFIIILVIMLYVLGDILREKWELRESFIYRYKIMKNDIGCDAKIAFIGSSGTRNGVNPLIIYEKTAYVTVNLAHYL